MTQKHRTELFRAFSKWGWDEKGWSQNTRNSYYQECLRAEIWLVENRNVSICFARPKDFKAYLFQTRPSPETRNKIRNALVGFGEFLVSQGYTEANPATGLPRLPVKKSIPKSLDRDSLKRILAVARTLGYVHEPLIAVLLYTGVRREEVRTLEWRSFTPDVAAPEVWMTFTGKGNKERAIPLHENAQKALVTWRRINGDPRWVFPSPRQAGRPIVASTINVLIRQIGEAVGFRLHPHLFRHTCATILLDSGNDLRTVQEWLGHADVSTTSIYTKVHPKNLVKARDTFDLEALPEENEQRPGIIEGEA